MNGVKLFAGTAGTPTIPAGAIIRRIVVVGAGGATVAMPDGSGGTVTIPVPAAYPHIVFDDGELVATTPMIRSAGSDVVFTSTTSYVVEVYIPSGVSVIS